MAHRLPTEFGTDAISKCGEIGTLEVDRSAAPQAHHHILGLLPVDELKMRLLRIEERLRDDSRFLQKPKRSIDRRL